MTNRPCFRYLKVKGSLEKSKAALSSFEATDTAAQFAAPDLELPVHHAQQLVDHRRRLHAVLPYSETVYVPVVTPSGAVTVIVKGNTISTIVGVPCGRSSAAPPLVYCIVALGSAATSTCK